MNALTVNGKQLTLGNTHVSLNYVNPTCVFFQSQSVLPTGTYKFIVNIPGAIEVKCVNLPTIGSDTILPIVNGVAVLTLTSDVNITNASIWPMYALDSNHYEMYEVYDSSSFELIRVNFGEILGYDDSIPSKTLLVLFDEGYEPGEILSDGLTFRRVSNDENLWYVTSIKTDGTFGHLSSNGSRVLEVRGGGDMSGITDVSDMFWACNSMRLYTPINFPDATIFDFMFAQCTSLTSMPVIDTTNAVSVESMFYQCVNMKTGIYAMYQQLAAVATISNHTYTFYDCGSNTVEGAAELAQIPASWGGTGA